LRWMVRRSRASSSPPIVRDDRPTGIAVKGDLGAVQPRWDAFGGLRVIDISDPASPVEVGNLYEALAVYGVAIAGNRAYLGNGYVTVVDVSNPQAPSEVGHYGDANAFGMAVSGIYAYVASWGAGLRIYEYYGAGVEEGSTPDASRAAPSATIVRGVLLLPRDMTEIRSAISGRVPRPVLLDISGSKALDLHPGPNDVSALAPGVYSHRLDTPGFTVVKKAVLVR
jgi:hypothetical protein